jgi:hypothetical protein
MVGLFAYTASTTEAAGLLVCFALVYATVTPTRFSFLGGGLGRVMLHLLPTGTLPVREPFF